MTGNKREHKRTAKKNALRHKYLLKEIEKDEMIKQDSMKASKRHYGKGQSK